MKVMISGGGTGGHIFPALSIAQSFLQKGTKQEEILFVGTKRGIESRVVPKAGFTLKTIRAEGIVGKGLMKKLRAYFMLIVSLLDAYKFIWQFKPSIVIGVGGYASGPLVFMASMRGIPTLIHEQNSVPGLTNRILGKFVDVIAISYENSQKYFPKKKSILTGNPVRETILHGSRTNGYSFFGLKEKRFTIFVFGGSQGAEKINKSVLEALEFLEDKIENIQFLHLTGYKDFKMIKDYYNNKGFHSAVLPFTENMADAYKVADLIISRSGAITLAEITLLGIGAILIPYPYAARNHQETNALELTANGAAIMIKDKDLNAGGLSSWIRRFSENPDELRTMGEKSRRLARPEASKKIVELALNLL